MKNKKQILELLKNIDNTCYECLDGFGANDNDLFSIRDDVEKIKILMGYKEKTK